MATSRTGTAQWKNVRKQRIQQSIEQGIHNCPRCRIPLDYTYPYRPNSAEVDHIKPHSQGGTDTIDNTQIMCRQCNQHLGAKQKKKHKPQTIEPPTQINW